MHWAYGVGIAKQGHHVLQAPPPELVVGRVGQSIMENVEICLPREPEMGEAMALEKQVSVPVKEI